MRPTETSAMWAPFKLRTRTWDLEVSNPSSASSASDALKHAHELRLLNLLLPTLLDVAPETVTKRESPDVEIVTGRGILFVEMVDAVPDAVSRTGTMNVAQRRSQVNAEPYRVEPSQFGAVIAREIGGKIVKARSWVFKEPALTGKLVLLVNGGQGPMWLRHYFPDANMLARYVVLRGIDPFGAVVVGDETGGFVRGSLLGPSTSSET